MAYIIPAPNAFQARFRRYECKYLVPEEQVPAIRRFIRGYVRSDPHAQVNPDRTYPITSLYLDSPGLRLLRETREGVLNRAKLRIRCYDQVVTRPVFLEIKRRSNGLVDKGRARLLRTDVEAMLIGGVPERFPREGEERTAFEEFLSLVGRWGVGPTAWVRYIREPYVGRFEPRLRVTLDRDFLCAPAYEPSLDYRRAAWQTFAPGRNVLELKFDLAYPHWLGALVHRFELERISFSKYGNAMTGALQPWYRIPG